MPHIIFRFNTSSLNEALVQPHFPASIETSIKDKNHQRSLPKGKITKVKLLPAVNVAWRLYKLSPDTNVSILTGSETGSSGITANLMRNKKQLLSYCIAALSYAHIYSERSWKPDDIDKIVDIAWNINRRTLMKRPMKTRIENQTELNEKTDVFYIDSIKFVTLTKASMTAGIIDNDVMASVKDFFNLLLENSQKPCVLEFNKKFFAFWYSDDKYFIFQPMNVFHKSPKCIQFSSFDCVQLYLQKLFIEIEPHAEYVFHSVDILKINNNVMSREEILKNLYRDAVTEFPERGGNFPDKSFDSNNVSHKMCLLPGTHAQSQTSYEQITEYKDILRCSKSIDRSGKISSTCVAAIVVLRVIRAVLWTSDTLSDILGLGSKIYKENLKLNPKGQTEIRVADIIAKIEFRSFQCLIKSQQIFFGKVESTDANICNIEQGLVQFFMLYLAGVIDGPNVVAVWKENNYYYMYDAKARNSNGLKLTREENAEGDSGMSCVTRFQHLSDLAEIYVENVPKKERNEYYKITHIELKPFLGKNWHQWKVVLPGQWCLKGEKSFKSKENLRACVTALLYAKNFDVKNWNPRTIDEIASMDQCTDHFPRERNLKEMKMELIFKEKPSFVSIKQKMFRYVVHALDKNIEDCLVKGFTMFFEANKQGIFSFNTKKTWKYFSIWKSGSNWFAFGLHIICNEDTVNEKKETWCALRFTSTIDMVKSLTANIVIRKNQEYSLSSVNLSEEDPKIDKKKLKNYKPLTTAEGCAGILRIGKNFDLFGSEEDDEVILKNTFHITAVIAMALIKDCWSWSNYDVWDILKISQKTFSVQSKELQNFYIKIGTTTIKLKEMQKLLWTKDSEMDFWQIPCKMQSEDQTEDNIKILKQPEDQIESVIKSGKQTEDQTKSVVKSEKETEGKIKSAIKSEKKTKDRAKTVIKTEKKANDKIESVLKNESQDKDQLESVIKVEKESKEQSESVTVKEKRNETLVIEDFMNKFEKQTYSNAILRSKHFQLALWKKDDAYFIFDLRDADEAGLTANGKFDKFSCPYVAWFDSMNGLLNHINANLCETDSESYELISFDLKVKMQNYTHKTWYNFSPVSDGSDQWMIRSLYGSLHYQYGITTCIIALVFATTLQPSNWNSSMLDSVLKYGMKLYKKSIKANTIELKLNTIVTPFKIGCYEFSFTSELLKCGANERYVLENCIVSLFNHADFGIISSKGYNASVWQQNNSYFIFDPQLNGMASLTRFSNISLISNHFLSHVRTGMTGVNVFEIFKISISRKMVQKKDCPIDIEAISKLTNRLTPDDGNGFTTNNSTRLQNIISDNAKWLEVGKTLPAECVVVAACVFGRYKNPEYWTANLTEEILSLGETIFSITAKQTNLGSSPLQPDQIQGIYPFDAKNAIHIRIHLFEVDDTSKTINENNVSDAANLSNNNLTDAADPSSNNATDAPDSSSNNVATAENRTENVLTSFFKLHDNAFLSTASENTLTAWKQAGRFYLFSSQPIEIDGFTTNYGQSKGVLLPFEDINELQKFLEDNFGDGNDLEDWLEIRSLEIDFVPIECLAEANQNTVTTVDKVGSASTCSLTLTGELCQCSSDEQGHMEKHAALNLAAIIMSTICDMKTWTVKTLHQIEVNGKALYLEASIESKVKQLTSVEFPLKFYIDHVEYNLYVSKNNTVHNLNEPTLTSAINAELKGGPALYFFIETHSFSLIEKDKIFYWYDPNGVEDPKNEIRSSVCCFSSMDLLVSYIVKIGSILQSKSFSVNSVLCIRL